MSQPTMNLTELTRQRFLGQTMTGLSGVFLNAGHPTLGFPSAGAWSSYALGSLNDNMPTYVPISDVRANRLMAKLTGPTVICPLGIKPSG